MVERIVKYKFILNFIWVGMILGVSFLAAPVKFQAELLTRPAAFDVGRNVFGVFNKVELMFWVLNMLFFGMNIKKKSYLKQFMLLSSVLAVQTLYLLPVLNERALKIMSGQIPQESWVHTLYVVLELAKLILLLLLGREQLKNTHPRVQSI